WRCSTDPGQLSRRAVATPDARRARTPTLVAPHRVIGRQSDYRSPTAGSKCVSRRGHVESRFTAARPVEHLNGVGQVKQPYRPRELLTPGGTLGVPARRPRPTGRTPRREGRARPCAGGGAQT